MRIIMLLLFVVEAVFLLGTTTLLPWKCVEALKTPLPLKKLFSSSLSSRLPSDPTEAALLRLNITIPYDPDASTRFSARPSFLPKIALASLPALLTFGSGVFANGYELGWDRKRSKYYSILSIGDFQTDETMAQGRTSQVEPLIIYEFEQCPYCRRVREAVSMLGLTVTYLPCPANGRVYRPQIKEKFGAEATFPYMEDPNTGTTMFESSDIVTYLFKTYGTGEEYIPFQLMNPFIRLTAALGLLVGGGGGVCKPSNFHTPEPPPSVVQVSAFGGQRQIASSSSSSRSNSKTKKQKKKLMQPLTFWAYEGSPFCKVVRDVLTELEIPHTQISTPRGAEVNRQRLFELNNRAFFQVPYVEDSNTEVCLRDSEVIVEYLTREYGVSISPVRYL